MHKSNICLLRFFSYGCMVTKLVFITTKDFLKIYFQLLVKRKLDIWL